jgi:hypothetical protein
VTMKASFAQTDIYIKFPILLNLLFCVSLNKWLLFWREALLWNIASNETFYYSFFFLVYFICEEKKCNLRLEQRYKISIVNLKKMKERKKESETKSFVWIASLVAKQTKNI